MKPKNQRNMSVPEKVWQDAEEILKTNKDFFDKYEIDTPSQVIRVLAQHGKEPLLQVIAEFHRLRKQKKENREEH